MVPKVVYRSFLEKASGVQTMDEDKRTGEDPYAELMQTDSKAYDTTDRSKKREHFMSIYDDMPDDAIDYLLKTYPRGSDEPADMPARSADATRRRPSRVVEEEPAKAPSDFRFSEFLSRLNIANVVLIATVLIFGIAVLFLVIRTNAVIKERDMLAEQLQDYILVQRQYQSLIMDFNKQKDENEKLEQELAQVSAIPQSNTQATQSGPDNIQAAENEPAIPETYTVKKGETLWLIAKRYYGKGELYTKIMEENGIKDDKKVGEGMVLKMPNLTD